MAMEQFDKWWKKDSWEGDWDYEEYAQRGWEAALEWVLAQETIKPLLGYSEHRYIDSIVIRKELGNE